MVKSAVFALGIVSMLALLFIFIAGDRAITGADVSEYEHFDIQPTLIANQPQYQSPSFMWPSSLSPLNPPPGLFPKKESLMPDMLLFFVDRIPIPEYTYGNVIPQDRASIHTYSAVLGYYDEDPTPLLQGYLCSYAYKFVNAPMRCERVPLSYSADGTVSFARGYAPGEFIAYQAAGTDFGALFVLANAHYGVLAVSPVAYLRYISG